MNTEPTTQPVSRVIEGDYGISRSGDGIKIEVLDYHADPLLLTEEILNKLGLTIVEERGEELTDRGSQRGQV